MTVFGLTGNIGCGKSTVGKLLAAAGFVHIDADYIGKLAAEPGTAANAEIRRAFGAEYFDGDGRLLRKKLGAHVFADPAELAKLNAILHPAVRAEIRAQIADNLRRNPQRHIVVEAAILLETGMADLVDKIIVVAASDEVRLQRVMARDGLPREQILERMANQMSQQEKIQRADYVIDNDGDAAALQQAVEDWLQSL